MRTVVQEVQTLSLADQADELDTHIQRLYRSDISRSTDTPEALLKRLGVADVAAAALLAQQRRRYNKTCWAALGAPSP